VIDRSSVLGAPHPADVADLGPGALGELASFDAPRFGGDRTHLLAAMLADPSRAVVVARRDRAIVGWAWVRPDADRVGPLVADSPGVAIALVAESLRRMPAAGSVRLTMPPGNRAGPDRLRSLGAELEPWNGRMARGPTVARREETIYASAVGALG
jgi:hypothetical protein